MQASVRISCIGAVGLRKCPDPTRNFGRLPIKQRHRSADACVHGLNPRDVKDWISIGKDVIGDVMPERFSRPQYNGVFSLLLVNLAVFIMDKLGVAMVKLLYLNHKHAQWWQFITCTFCHADWAHISSNIFMIYVFGKIVEEEGGPWAVWLTYLVSGLGGSVASFLLDSGASTGLFGFSKAATVTLGASGAVFGLFATSVLLKLSFNWRKIIEAVILGQFVFQQIWQEIQSQAAANASSGISHAAHLGGALAGVLLIYLLSRIPEPGGGGGKVLRKK